MSERKSAAEQFADLHAAVEQVKAAVRREWYYFAAMVGIICVADLLLLFAFGPDWL